MARLTDQQALEKLTNPKNRDLISQAVLQEERLTMHTEPIQDGWRMPQRAYNDFLGWVSRILVKDKYERFLQMLSFPFDTVDSTKTIFDELSRVFDAQDQYRQYDFKSTELADEFLDYLKTIDYATFWKVHGFEALRNRINSLVVIDMPAQQGTFRPQPYVYLLSISDVIDVDFNYQNFKVEYVAYRQPGNMAVVIDDEYYRVFTKPDNADWRMEYANPHTRYDANGSSINGIGYCPVTSFYNKAIKGSKHINKRGPLTDVLGKLDTILFNRTSFKYYEMYASWPIIVSLEEQCEYRDDKGNACMDGYINTYATEPVSGKEIHHTIECPACAKRNLLGPGTQFTVKAPMKNDQFNPMEKPVEIVTIDTDSLDYWTTRIDSLEDEVYLSAVGYDGDAMNNKAVNETQVGANFESKESVLATIKTEFERVDKFTIDTMARIMYGNLYVKSIIDWGSEYFLKSIDTLTQQLKDAKLNGMPMYYLNTLRTQIVQTKAKNNPDQQQRNQILAALEPYPDLTLGELSSNGIKEDDPINYIIKLNFNTFIQRFEREEANLLQFGSLIPFDRKIAIINQKLQEYGEEKRRAAPGAQNESTGNAGTAGQAVAG